MQINKRTGFIHLKFTNIICLTSEWYKEIEFISLKF